MRSFVWTRVTMVTIALLAGLAGCATPPANPARSTGQAAPAGILPSSAPKIAVPEQIAPPAAVTAPAPRPMVRMALLLPLHSSTLGSAARAIRDGFLAAYERDPDGVAVSALDTDDNPEQTVHQYAQVQQEHDIVIGPLQRQAVAAVAQSGQVNKPTLALNQPEAGSAPGETAAPELPANMLAMGLSGEDEARQLARWASASAPERTAYAIFGPASWQRRAAAAFAAQRLKLGLATKMAEVSGSAGDARIGDVLKLQMRLQAEPPGTAPLLFMALDFEAVRALRASLGETLALYGTSQLNPNVAGNRALAAPDLNGVRLLDLPWQLQMDDAAVMLYPRPLSAPDAKPDPDLARLYALGIDAYRVARAIAHDGQRRFTLDGVTGKLAVRIDDDGARFERTEVPAIYRDGVAQPLAEPAP